MTSHTWLAFLLATAVLLAIPGPTVLIGFSRAGGGVLTGAGVALALRR
jgi:threonine/homoserine/homoserine lactone efflux protein